MKLCHNYDTEWWHYFIPSGHEFLRLCRSTDKTKLFITYFVKTLLYSQITVLMYKLNLTSLDSQNSFKLILFYIMLTITISHLFMLIFIILI